MSLLTKATFILLAVTCLCSSEAKADVTTTYTFSATWGGCCYGSGRGFLIPSDAIVAASVSGTFGYADHPNGAVADVFLNDVLVAQCLPGEECANYSSNPTPFHHDFTPDELGPLRRIFPGPSGFVSLAVLEEVRGPGGGITSLGELTVSVTTASPPPADPDAPILLTEENAIYAIALDSVVHLRGPFMPTLRTNFGHITPDPRARVVLFLANADLTGQDPANVLADAWITSITGYASVTVEDIRPVRDLPGVTQVVVRIPEPNANEYAIRIFVNGIPSNAAIVKMIY